MDTRRGPDPRTVGCNCTECPFGKDGGPGKYVWGERLGEQHEALFVGEGPGESEESADRVFVGATGERLNKELLDAGFVRSKQRIVNATLCRPAGDKSAQRMGKAVRCCAPAFKLQTADSKAPLFTMGRWAWGAWAYLHTGRFPRMPKGGLDRAWGFIRDNRYIVSHHPTYAFFRNPWWLGSWRIAARRFRRLVDRRVEADPDVVTGRLGDIAARAAERGWVSCDVETEPESWEAPWTGKDPTRARLKTVGLGVPGYGCSVHWPSASVAERQQVALLLKTLVVVGHNFRWFDERVLVRYGLLTPRIEDTRDMRKALAITSPLSLAHLVATYRDAPPWKEGDEYDEKLIDTQDLEKLMRYNAFDAVYTADCYERMQQEKEWNDERIQRIYRVNCRTSRVAAQMHSRGFGVHSANRIQLAGELESLFDERERRFVALVGEADSSLTTDVRCTASDLRAVVFASRKREGLVNFGMPDPPPWDHDLYTEGGDISVDQSALLMLYTRPDCPPQLREIIKAYWQAESAWKARSTFVTSKLVDHALGEDGRLRAGFNNLATDTGRWGCSDPNLQTIPESKDE